MRFPGVSGFSDKFIGVLRQVLGRVAAFILDHDRKAGTGTQSGNRRRSEGEHFRRIDRFVQFPVQHVRNFVSRHFTLFVIFEPDENQSAVGCFGSGQEAETGRRRHRLDVVVFAEHLLKLVDHFLRASQRSGVRQLDIGHQVTLVFIGEKSCRHCFNEQQDDRDDDADQDQRTGAVPDNDVAGFQVIVDTLFKSPVEPAEKAFSLGLPFRTEQQGTEGPVSTTVR